MSNQNIPSDLLVELSIEQQQLLSGGYSRDKDYGDHGDHGVYGSDERRKRRRRRRH